MSESPEAIQFLRITCRHDGGTYHGPVEPDSIEGVTGLKVAVTPGATYKAVVEGHSFRIKAKGKTLEECEQDAVGQIVGLKRMLALLTIKMMLPMTLAESALRFLVGLGQLPPLVRASWGAIIASWMNDSLSRDRLGFDPNAAPRRARVRALHNRASSLMLGFAVDIANEGDAEAERLGIDADVRYAGRPEDIEAPVKSWAKSWVYQRTADVLQGVADGIQVEIDAKVLADIGNVPPADR